MLQEGRQSRNCVRLVWAVLVQIHNFNFSHRILRILRWSSKFKAVSLSLYHFCPKCYRLLKKVFLLPSTATLKRVLRSIYIYPGFNQNLLGMFKEKVKGMTDSDKQCSIILDEMSIKSNLTYHRHRDSVEGLEDLEPIFGETEYVGSSALVFMARGLNGTWKQPIGYFVTSSSIKPELLKSLLLSAIDFAMQTGLQPLVVLCYQGSNNQSCYRTHLGVTVEKPYFQYKDQQIVCMYNSPHLLKNIRNNLKSNGLLVSGDPARWEHL